MNINRFVEFADICFVYVLANENTRAAVRFHRERFRTRREPNYQTFAQKYQNVAKRGSFTPTMHDTVRPQIARIIILEEGLLQAVYRNTGTHVEAFAAATGASRKSAHRGFLDESLFSFILKEFKYCSQMITPELSR